MTTMPHVEGMTHSHVDIGGGVRLHVAEMGSGPPVVMLHGWPQHWYAWRKVAPLLATDHRVICPDLRGFGWSDVTPGTYGKRWLSADIVALLDALELDRVHLAGHDWGAWIGFILCLEHPERFSHYLALNMYTPWPEPPSPRGLGTLLRFWYQVALSAPGLGRTLIRHTRFVRQMITTGAQHPDSWTDADIEAYTGVLREPDRATASVRLYRTFLLRELFSYARGEFTGRRLTMPTLLLHGTHDLAIDHHRLGAWREHADDMDVELRDDSGHFILEELPDVVADRARALFSRAASPDSSGPPAGSPSGRAPDPAR